VVGIVLVILLGGVLGRQVYRPYANRPAIVKLDVKPRGEVYVDGVLRGRTPPLTQVDVVPGTRRITVRSAGLPPFEAVMELRPGQEATVTHTFARAPSRPESLWQDFKKRFN
jgi:hypothetical protein